MLHMPQAVLGTVHGVTSWEAQALHTHQHPQHHPLCSSATFQAIPQQLFLKLRSAMTTCDRGIAMHKNAPHTTSKSCSTMQRVCPSMLYMQAKAGGSGELLVQHHHKTTFCAGPVACLGTADAGGNMHPVQTTELLYGCKHTRPLIGTTCGKVCKPSQPYRHAFMCPRGHSQQPHG